MQSVRPSVSLSCVVKTANRRTCQWCKQDQDHDPEYNITDHLILASDAAPRRLRLYDPLT